MDMTPSDSTVYPRKAHPLTQEIAHHLEAARPTPVDGEVYALIVPHTNQLDGARVAAEAYKLIEGFQVDTVLLIAPPSNGAFQRINVCQSDEYHTPLGTLRVNDRMRHELCDEDDDIYLDDSGHFNQDGIDVQLPYLQTVLGEFNIVPVIMGQESPEFCRELGHAIGEVTYNQHTLIIASVDLLAGSDENLVEFTTLFEKMDVSRMMGLLNSERVHLAGKGPLLATLIAAQHRRIDNARVLRITPAGDDDLGYVSAVIWR